MNKSILKSTGIVAASTLMSRIMGFARDMVIAGVFGATGSLDGFWIAFKIPNLFRRLVAEGSLTISFVPVYTEYLMNKTWEESLELAQKTLSILLLVLVIIVTIGEIFSPEIVGLFGYGFTDADQIDLTIVLNRIMFPYLFLVSIVAFAMGYLNSHRYFFAPAFATVLLNVGFIIGAVFLRHYFERPLYGLALGVIIGGILQLLLQIPYLIKTGFKLKLSIDFNHPGIRAIFRMMGPALLGIAIYQINSLMSAILASLLPEGSISYIYYSDRLTELVLGVFVISLSNVILPELSSFSAVDNFNKIRELYVSSIKGVLFISIPAFIALMIIGLPIISILFMRGEFTSYDVENTYIALFYSSIGIAAISINRITVPTFYSLKDTKTPVKASAVSFVINICLGYALMQTELKHGGLTLALSIASTVQMLILVLILQKKIGNIEFRQLFIPILKYIIAVIPMAFLIWYIAGFVDWFNDLFIIRLLYLFAIIFSGGILYLIGCIFLRVEEIKYIKKGLLNPIIQKLQRRA